MSDYSNEWRAQSPERDRAYAEEDFIFESTETLWRAMDAKQISKTVLAERLGVSKSHITQVLTGARNMTLRTYAAMAHALGLRPRVVLDAQAEVRFGTQLLVTDVPQDWPGMRYLASPVEQLRCANDHHFGFEKKVVNA